MGEWLLGLFRDLLQPWHASHPRWVTSIYAVALVATIALALFYYLRKPIEHPSSSGTTVNFGGLNIGQITVTVQGVTAIPPPAPNALASLIENGDFERGFYGWGTGFYEGLFLQLGDGRTALSFNNAQARWFIDDRRAHSGRRSLRVEHTSPYMPHVFSSFSQRIKVRPSTSYRVTYSALIESVERGAFSLRVVPSRRPAPPEWDQFKRKVDPAVIGQWQDRILDFESGSDWFFDLRFAAEGPIRAWIDDVAVVEIPR